ncbi:hypothetical protein CEXT_52411 [Caerostris extrusa]|uniref:Uncharacterized protein n=1 Tax=Caerostris extrusa TaxID=172846 RepID=A0AAV4RNK9_CAEEX|nr:hypothetical protein CEXT_52411 [Caerostris extrusa]
MEGNNLVQTQWKDKWKWTNVYHRKSFFCMQRTRERNVFGKRNIYLYPGKKKPPFHGINNRKKVLEKETVGWGVGGGKRIVKDEWALKSEKSGNLAWGMTVNKKREKNHRGRKKRKGCL